MVNKRTYRSKSKFNDTIKPIPGILNLCRLCLGEAKDRVPIFADKNDICSSLATRIMMCVGYEVTHEDCLPNAICPECHNEINNFYKFKKKCYNTYYALKTHIFAVRKDIKCENNAIKSGSDCPNSQAVNKINESVNTVSQPVYQVSQSDSPVSQLVCPIIQSDCTVNDSGCTVTQSNNPVSQLPSCPISQSFCPISQSVSPVSQSIHPVAQSVRSVGHSVSSVNQSVYPVSQSFSTVNQSVYPVTQSMLTLSPVNESICTASQSVYPVTQSVFTIKQSDCPVSQAIFKSSTEIHPSSMSQSNCKNRSDNTEYQLVYPLYQSGSQPVTSLVSESVAETRDQLILAFEDVTQLEFIHTELRQNGFHNLVNFDEMTETIEIAVTDKGVEEAKTQEVETAAQTEVCPNIAGYLSAILLEMGIFKNSSSDGDVEMTEDCSSIMIDTKDGEHIQLELLQVEDSITEKMEEQKTSANETKKVSKKATKRGTDERPQCAVCGRRVASRGVLARHLRVHTGERPFRCARCGLAFAQREVLRRHELVHQEVRPYACSRCPKSFTQRAALAVHARGHEPPCARSLQMHPCTMCPKMFLHASGLSRHMLAHAGRTFQCPLCGRYFSDGSSVRRHMRCKHQQVDA